MNGDSDSGINVHALCLLFPVTGIYGDADAHVLLLPIV